ncbi:MAG: hypothetical protein PHY10_04050, partial [Patescibacteria group bacterium]|nr:hypothetical protein [Patescibacteria group bacterium]
FTNPNLSPIIKEYLEHYAEITSPKPSSELIAKIHVDEIASRIAGFYNNVRNIIEYREEHLLRKGIIERTLKRYLTLVQRGQNIAEPFLKEIIRSGHLPNNAIPEARIKDLQKIIDKYVFLMQRLTLNHVANRQNLKQWLLKNCSCEIEEKIDPPLKDNLSANLMYQIIKSRLVIQGAQLSEEDKNIEIFINIQKSLLRADETQLNYRLLKFLYPSWSDLSSENMLMAADIIPTLHQKIKKYLKNPLGKYFSVICNQYNTIFYLIGDIVFTKDKNITDPGAIFDNPELLDKAIKGAYRKRFEKARSKLGRLAFLSIVSFFLSKIIIALLIEVPLDKYLIHTFSVPNTIVSILFPPFLMMLIVAAARMPSEKNLKLVIEESQSVVYQNKAKKYLLRVPPPKSWFGETSVQIFYLISFFISFGLLTLALLSLKFSVASSVIFLFFTSLVAVTGVKIHNRARELSLEQEGASFSSFLIDIFSMPLVTVGRWAAYGLTKINLLVLVLDLAIETPFQMFITFLENLRGFIKHKKEEIY